MSKILSMQEAVSEFVQDDTSLIIAGFTHLICFAAAHEIIRQKKKNLTAIRLTPDLIYDQMIEAGCVKKLVFSWAGNPGVGSLHALRRVSEAKSKKRIELDEYSHFAMVMRMQAGAAGLPFAVLDNLKACDIAPNNKNIKSIICPYTAKEFSTVPAVKPDLCILHCQRADAKGNAQVWGLMGSQKESAFAAKKVIVVAEEIVDEELIRQDPNRTLVPAMIVSAVVHEPWGCHPSYVQGYYDRDNDFYVKWDKISRDQEVYKNYLEEFVYSCANRQEYLAKLDSKIIDQLTAKTLMSTGVNYGY